MILSLPFIAATAGFIGKVLIAFTAIMVSHRFRKEHKVDAQVFRTMWWEQVYGFIGIFLLLVEYIINVLLI